MKVHAYGITDVGRRRDNNQDQLLVDDQQDIYAIADGMGGHAAGEVASRIAIQALAESINDRPEGLTPEQILVTSFNEGNRRICESVLARAEWRGMGTTIVAILRRNERAFIAHVGDSRCYLLRDNELSLLTEDHSWVGEQVRLGLLTEDEAAHHPMRNIVTRAMGNRLELEVDVSDHDIREGDRFLLCSDGLNSMIEDTEIAELLRTHHNEPEAACRALVEAANRSGGDDNITVVVVAA